MLIKVAVADCSLVVPPPPSWSIWPLGRCIREAEQTNNFMRLSESDCVGPRCSSMALALRFIFISPDTVMLHCSLLLPNHCMSLQPSAALCSLTVSEAFQLVIHKIKAFIYTGFLRQTNQCPALCYASLWLLVSTLKTPRNQAPKCNRVETVAPTDRVQEAGGNTALCFPVVNLRYSMKCWPLWCEPAGQVAFF